MSFSSAWMQVSAIVLTFAVVVGIILVIHGTFPKYSSAMKGSSTKSLYDRLGGIFSIALVVNRFSDQIIENPKVGRLSPNPYLRDWSINHLDRLPGLKWMRTLWLASISGGPYTFVATRPGKTKFGLEKAHCPFHISSDEFDEVAKELSLAMEFYKVPDPEQNEVLQVFMAHKTEVIACSL